MSQRPFRFDSRVAERWGAQTVDEIAADLGCSVATVYNAAARLDLPRRHRSAQHRWTTEEDQLLRSHFSTMRPRELEELFALSFEQVRTRAKRLGIPSLQATERRAIEHDFFERATPETAYYAGLLAADGWIGARNAINLALKVSDRATVDRFSAAVNSSRDVRVYQRQARATVTSAQMVIALDERWNIRRAKTYNLEPPRIEDPTLQLAYAAGHLDGDGFIVGPGRAAVGARIRCGALGTEPVIRWIGNVLDAHLAAAGRPRGVRVAQLRGQKYSFPMFEWRTSDHNAVALLDAMRDVIGDLGIRRKWAVHETYRAVLTARHQKEAAA